MANPIDVVTALVLLGALTVAASFLGDRDRRSSMCPSANGCKR